MRNGVEQSEQTSLPFHREDGQHAPPIERQTSGYSIFSQISFWALLLSAAGIGVLFFLFIRPFFAPLFFATVLAILVRPAYTRLTKQLGGHRRLAALLTVGCMFVLLAGLGAILLLAARELASTGRAFADVQLTNQPIVERTIDLVDRYAPDVEWQALRESLDRGVEQYTTDTLRRTGDFLTSAVEIVVGMAVMALALYFFLAEGGDILASLRAISPFAREDEWLLFTKFASISRGVVVGIFVCAFAQATLLGMGLYFAGIERLWLLTGLTFLFSMIPFIGSAGVWVPVAGWLLWQGEITTGVLLAVYGAAVVSSVDNLIRAYVLHESAEMHPLLALISALGALQIVGLWGIFLGPVVAAFFYSMLKILHDRLGEGEPTEPAAPTRPPGVT